MKTDITLHLLLTALSLTAAAAPTDIQHPLTETTHIPIFDSNINSPKQYVPGHNNAFYGPIPKASQIFNIEFLEIAPSPIPV